MKVKLKSMCQKHFLRFIAPILLVLATLNGVVLSFAQGPMAHGAGGFGAAFLSDDDDEGLMKVPMVSELPEEPDPGLPDLPPIDQTSNSATPQSQGQGSSTQDSSAEASHRISVNPITGLVTTSGPYYTPLTGQERWKLYWKMNYFSLGAYFGPFFSALVLDQATGSPQQWGGGFEGYGRRVASRTASAMMQGTFQAPVAYLLHEDVRYIASKRPGFRHRALHAIAYSFLTYNSSGHPTPNVANMGAYYASTAITTAWLPGHYKVLSYTVSNASEQIVLTFPINIVQEFWPEIAKTFHRR
jgi:hypothetical protein